MKVMNIFFCALVTLFIMACKSYDNGLFEFEPRTLKENKISLSEIADGVSYIPLDNILPLGEIFNIEFIKDAVYFTSKDIGILKYDREGKFVRKIGSIGRGPGEYIYSPSFTVDDKNGTIYTLNLGGIIKVYSRTGKFIKDLSLQKYGDMIDAIKFHDSKLFVTYAIQNGNAKYKWIACDTLGNVIKKKDREIPIFTANSGGREAIYRFENKLSYWNNYSDTVFSILPDLSEEPSFIISPGEHRIPRSNLTMEQVQNWHYMQIITIFETSRFILIDYSYNNPALLLRDKRTGDYFLTYHDYDKKTGDLLSGLRNDLDAGPWFIPECYFSEMGREYMVGLIYPYQIKFLVSSNEFINSTPKYPEKKKELEKLANSLKETDNPVLMLVRLKK